MKRNVHVQIPAAFCLIFLLPWLQWAAETNPPELVSPLGKKLYAKDASQAQLLALAAMDKELEKEPGNIEVIFRKAHSLEELFRFNEAIRLYGTCIQGDPSNPVFYRWMGHRYINIRQFDKAIELLEKAAEMNGANRIRKDQYQEEWGTPLWRLEFDIRYQLAFAYYVKGQFEKALREFRICYREARDDMALIAATYWLYNTLGRIGDSQEAKTILDPITEKMDAKDNFTYHNLLLMFKGLLSESDLLKPEKYKRFEIAAYGIAVFRLVNDDLEGAMKLFERAVEDEQWSGFGYIASEVELMKRKAN